MSVTERLGLTIIDAVDAKLHPKWTGHLNGVEFQYLKRPAVCSTVIFDNLEYAKRSGIRPVSLGHVMEKLEEQKTDIFKIVLFDTPAEFLPGNHFRVGRVDREKNEASLVFCGFSGLYDRSDEVSPLTVLIDKPFFTGFMVFDYRKDGRAVSLSDLAEGAGLVKGKRDYGRLPDNSHEGPRSTYWADSQGRLAEWTKEEKERRKKEAKKTPYLVTIDGREYKFRCDAEEFQGFKRDFEAGFMADRIIDLVEQAGKNRVDMFLKIEDFLKKANRYIELRDLLSHIRRNFLVKGLREEFKKLGEELGFPSDNAIALKFVKDKGIAVESIDS